MSEDKELAAFREEFRAWVAGMQKLIKEIERKQRSPNLSDTIERRSVFRAFREAIATGIFVFKMYRRGYSSISIHAPNKEMKCYFDPRKFHWDASKLQLLDEVGAASLIIGDEK